MLTATGLLYCWGSNGYGQVGDNTTSVRSKPVAVTTGAMSGLTGISQISAGSYHHCAITVSGVPHCWGYGTTTHNLIGDGSTTNRHQPTPLDLTNVTGEQLAIDIHGSHNFSCLRSSQSNVYCWGNNGSSKLGNNWGGGEQTVPVAVHTNNLSGSTKFKKYQPVGTDTSCGVAGDGKMYCAGRNVLGTVGDGTTDDWRERPVSVSYTNISEADKTARNITSGRGHSGDNGSHSVCAVMTGGGVYCWGQNNQNQTGPGSALKRSPATFTGY